MEYRDSPDRAGSRDDDTLPSPILSAQAFGRKSGPIFGFHRYKRVIIWTTISLIIVSLGLLRNQGPYSSTSASAYREPPMLTAHPTTESNTEPTEYVDIGDPPPLKETTGVEETAFQDGSINVDPEESEPTHDNEAQYAQDEDEAGADNDDDSTPAESEQALEIEEEDGHYRVSMVVEESDAEKAEALEASEEETQNPEGEEDIIGAPDEETIEEDSEEDSELSQMPWLKFKHLDGYFHGLKSIVSKDKHTPEYPSVTNNAPLPSPPLQQEVPRATIYSPYHADSGTQACFLDEEEQIPAPNMYAYNGVVQHAPDPAIGSYDILGLRDDVCFDRFGRFGPYGLGYAKEIGGAGVGNETEASGSEELWMDSGPIDYTLVDWGDAQNRCAEVNQHRFRQVDPLTDELEEKTPEKKGRIAVVVRLYTYFKWTEHAVLNFRALVSELSLKSGAEYDVHFLLHVRDTDEPIWADEVTVQRILDDNVPREFHSMVTIWNEPQMKLYYAGDFQDPASGPSGHSVYGSYRSAHFPLQVFALHHPEYEHIWNWEMDMRYTGNYYELMDRAGAWARKQSRAMMWERSERYYIPSVHGSWDDFVKVVQNNTLQSGRKTIFGPVQFENNKPLRSEQQGEPMMPDSCYSERDKAQCGVGEEADLITFNPIFDTDQSGWVFGLDATGYGSNPPRRSAIITASRLSRRLLMAMHEEVWRYRHTMFSEMFPSSVALHHGHKAVYAPHPLYLDRAWNPPEAIDEAFNSGRDHSTSGDGSPFALANEHNHKGSTWYFNSEFAGLLWRRWLGYAQWDGRGQAGGRSGEGSLQGGVEAESAETSSGRMCLRSMLLHPIKHEDPDEIR